MKSSESNPIVGTVYVDKFAYGGKEDLKQGRSKDSKKKKIVAAVEIDDKGGVKELILKELTTILRMKSIKFFKVIFLLKQM